MSRKKNVNIVTLSMGAGGAEKVISLLLPRLVADFNVTLILFTNEIHFNIPSGVKVYFLSNDVRQTFWKKLVSPFLMVPRYKAILNITKPDISISFLTRANFLNSLVNVNQSKIILSERCYPSIAYKSNFFRFKLYEFLIPKLYNRADIIFSNSIFINGDLKDNFGVKTQLSVIYNPVDTQFENTNSLEVTSDLDIIWVGKLVEIKNPRLLIDALKENRKEFRTAILGEGNLEKDLRVDSQGLDVLFTGKVSNVSSYMLRSRLFVLTSNSEGFPNVILEAMSFGLPIIATNCMSGPLELINDGEAIDIERGSFTVARYGILVNVGDSVGLASAIAHVLHNESLERQLGVLSFQRSKQYSVQKIYTTFKEKLLI